MIHTSCRLSLIITPVTPHLKVRNKKESATTVMIYNSFLTPCTELRTWHFSRFNNRYNSNSKIAEDKRSRKQKQEKTRENFNLVVDWFPSAMACANLRVQMWAPNNKTDRPHDANWKADSSIFSNSILPVIHWGFSSILIWEQETKC